MSQFYQVFFDEVEEHLGAMDSALTSIDPLSPDRGTLNRVLLSAHSIRGSSATFGFDDMAQIAGSMETALDLACKGKAMVSAELIDTCRQACAVLREQLDHHADGCEGHSEATQKAYERLERISCAAAGAGQPEIPSADSSGAGDSIGCEDSAVEPAMLTVARPALAEDDPAGAYGFFARAESAGAGRQRDIGKPIGQLRDQIDGARRHLERTQKSLRGIAEIADAIDALAQQARTAGADVAHSDRSRALGERLGFVSVRLRTLLAASADGIAEAVALLADADRPISEATEGLPGELGMTLAALHEALAAHEKSCERLAGSMPGMQGQGSLMTAAGNPARALSMPPGPVAPVAAFPKGEAIGAGGMRGINRVDAMVAVAELHKASAALSAYLAGNADQSVAPAVECDAKCPLNHWLDATPADSARNGDHAVIIRLHERFHACAAKIAEAMDSGQPRRALADFQREFSPLLLALGDALSSSEESQSESVPRKRSARSVVRGRVARAGGGSPAPLPKVSARTSSAKAMQQEWETS